MMRFLSKTADIILLNVLFIICCIPVITIGASLTALFSVTLKLADNEESYIIKNFFTSFRSNFRQSTLLWLSLLLTAGIAVFDFFTVPASLPYIGRALHLLLGAVILTALIFAAYAFPCLARFEGSLKCIVKNALLLGIANLPKTLLLVLLPFVLAAATFCFGLSAAGLVYTLCGFSLTAFAASFLLKKIFIKYEANLCN